MLRAVNEADFRLNPAERVCDFTGIVQRSDGPVSDQALADSVKIVREMHQYQTADTNDDLMALQRKLKESKGIKA